MVIFIAVLPRRNTEIVLEGTGKIDQARITALFSDLFDPQIASSHYFSGGSHPLDPEKLQRGGMIHLPEQTAEMCHTDPR